LGAPREWLCLIIRSISVSLDRAGLAELRSRNASQPGRRDTESQSTAHRTIFKHWISKAEAADDPGTITQLGIDETSIKKGHHYVTLGVDLDTFRVIYVTEGKGKATLKSIQQHLENKGVDKTQVEQISMDLSPSFIAGAAESFPDAQITFGRFHVVKLLNETMNQVRIIERKEHDELKGHKTTFLRNRENLSDTKQKSLAEMITLYPTLGEAYRLKVLFNDLWEMPDKPTADAFLRQWCVEVDAARMPGFMKFANTVRAHGRGLFISLNQALLTAFLKASIVRFSWLNVAQEATAILITSSI